MTLAVLLLIATGATVILGRVGLGWRAAATSSAVLVLAVAPAFVSEFWVKQILSQTLYLGIIAMSLIFLAGLGGMVSLAQVSVAGLAGYAVAILVTNYGFSIGLGIVAGVVAGPVAGFLFGAISVRTEGIYLLMITVALAMLTFFLAQQNFTIFGGHRGFAIDAPVVGALDWGATNPFYYLSLTIAVLLFAFVKYVDRTPFGLALQGVRDNPRRMSALGYWVGLHRVVAFAVAGFIAGFGGILLGWYKNAMSPNSINLEANIDLLIIAMVGGVVWAEGAFIGAFVFTWLDNFTAEFFSRERFNTVIGLIFVVVLLWDPDGLLGIGRRIIRGVQRIFRRPDPGDVAGSSTEGIPQQADSTVRLPP
ncbi:MAG: branched-chain amino acid ABC transporter permease [Acidimicrobiia bacterium]